MAAWIRKPSTLDRTHVRYMLQITKVQSLWELNQHTICSCAWIAHKFQFLQLVTLNGRLFQLSQISSSLYLPGHSYRTPLPALPGSWWISWKADLEVDEFQAWGAVGHAAEPQLGLQGLVICWPSCTCWATSEGPRLAWTHIQPTSFQYIACL